MGYIGKSYIDYACGSDIQDYCMMYYGLGYIIYIYNNSQLSPYLQKAITWYVINSQIQ